MESWATMDSTLSFVQEKIHSLSIENSQGNVKLLYRTNITNLIPNFIFFLALALLKNKVEDMKGDDIIKAGE
jgi:hypothetical protein